MTRSARRYLVALVSAWADPHWCPWCRTTPRLVSVDRYGLFFMRCMCGVHSHASTSPLDCWCAN